jgi:hypothetical protein
VAAIKASAAAIAAAVAALAVVRRDGDVGCVDGGGDGRLFCCEVVSGVIYISSGEIAAADGKVANATSGDDDSCDGDGNDVCSRLIKYSYSLLTNLKETLLPTPVTEKLTSE